MAEAGKIDRYRAKARRGDAVEHGQPDAAPIGSMKQERQDRFGNTTSKINYDLPLHQVAVWFGDAML
jgi:hypothetical protein